MTSKEKLINAELVKVRFKIIEYFDFQTIIGTVIKKYGGLLDSNTFNYGDFLKKGVTEIKEIIIKIPNDVSSQDYILLSLIEIKAILSREKTMAEQAFYKFDSDRTVDNYFSVFHSFIDYLESNLIVWVNRDEKNEGDQEVEKRRVFSFGKGKKGEEKELLMEMNARQKVIVFYYLNNKKIDKFGEQVTNYTYMSIFLGVLLGVSIHNLRTKYLKNIQTDFDRLRGTIATEKEKKILIEDIAVVFSLFIRIKYFQIAKEILKDIPPEYWENNSQMNIRENCNGKFLTQKKWDSLINEAKEESLN